MVILYLIFGFSFSRWKENKVLNSIIYFDKKRAGNTTFHSSRPTKTALCTWLEAIVQRAVLLR
jgi:hypothetical protein